MAASLLGDIHPGLCKLQGPDLQGENHRYAAAGKSSVARGADCATSPRLGLARWRRKLFPNRRNTRPCALRRSSRLVSSLPGSPPISSLRARSLFQKENLILSLHCLKPCDGAPGNKILTPRLFFPRPDGSSRGRASYTPGCGVGPVLCILVAVLGTQRGHPRRRSVPARRRAPLPFR